LILFKETILRKFDPVTLGENQCQNFLKQWWTSSFSKSLRTACTAVKDFGYNPKETGLGSEYPISFSSITFAEIKAVGKEVSAGSEVATIETMKVNVELPSPITGKVVEVNPVLTTAPEAINQDPFGNGWLAVIEASDWNSEKTHLLDPQAYFEKMKADAEREVKS
jgi:glycine cleavage system H protein